MYVYIAKQYLHTERYPEQGLKLPHSHYNCCKHLLFFDPKYIGTYGLWGMWLSPIDWHEERVRSCTEGEIVYVRTHVLREI